MADQTGRDSDKFMLRLPNGMRDRIKEKADENGRSMNAEIVFTLDAEYPPPPPDDRVKALIERFQKIIPKDEQEEFLMKYLKENVPDDYIEDGLIPGVKLKKE